MFFSSLRLGAKYRLFVSIYTFNRKMFFGTDSSSQRLHSQEKQSSLYISAKHELNSVLQPSFDSHYLKYVADNIESIQRTMTIRGLNADFSTSQMKTAITQFSELSEKVDVLKKKRNKLLHKIRKKVPSNVEFEAQFTQIKQKLIETRTSFYELENEVVPFLLNIPCDIRQDIEYTEQVIDQFEGSSIEQIKQLGAISYVRLGYINNIFHSSIVGPNAQFFLGSGAQMFYALSDYLSDLFEQSQFVPVSGLDIVKSALIEAVNSKEVQDDPYMIRIGHHEHDENQRLHLTGDASIESLCAWISKLVDQPVGSRFLQLGSSYIDSLSQSHSIRATILVESSQSDAMMEQLYVIWWKALTQLLLKCCSIRCSLSSLQPNEHAKYDLLVWLHSKQQWTHVGHVSHHSNYLSQRIGSPQLHSKHLVSSSVDLVQLLKCLFEHYQDPNTGKVNYPKCLTNYFSCNE